MRVSCNFFPQTINLQTEDVQLVVAFWFHWQSLASISFQKYKSK